MGLPGFDAEASLYRSNRDFQITNSAQGQIEGAKVMPQFQFAWDFCTTKTLFCPDGFGGVVECGRIIDKCYHCDRTGCRQIPK
ncbi:MAG: hypothetical protein C4288_07970 [Leptolyngbya sp. ERB_1_1]